MVTVYDVSPKDLINALAKKLKEIGLKKPEFVDYVKTGSHKEKPPEQEEFWWIRSASILRKAYINGKIGVNKLRKEYAKRKNKGVKPEHSQRAGGKIIRKALQELEKLGLLKKADDGKGRVLTSKGRSLMDNIAREVTKVG